MTKDEALGKAMKLCSVKEYATSDIVQKITDWGLDEESVNQLINILHEDKFLDDFRFARFFANDKLRFNKWGKLKIKYMLQQKNVSREALSEALEQINEREYAEIITNELVKKRKSIKDADSYKVKAKLFQFAAGRGFEADLIYKLIDKVM
ncbi:MAG: regulatory protein RecX [Bacteroidota bacterium]|nr:regulatory protein RecX [Bacteroidota bacterium]